MRRVLLPLLFACGSAAKPVVSKPPPPPPDPIEAVADKAAQDALDAGDIASVTIAVARRDGPTFVKAYGEADRTRHIAAQRDTIYRIGSLTKQFTAAAILQLAEQGKLSLDDDITKYVRVETQGHTVSLRQLLQHTSGIPSYTDMADFPEWAKKPAAPQQIVERTAKMLWEFEPGTHFHYTNTGYVLLGIVIEKVTNQRYAVYLHQHVFAPLHLDHTFYCDDTHGARGYTTDNGKLADAAPLDLSVPFSAGALCSTAPDLVAWARGLASGLVVAPASYADMITPPAGIHSTYGYGLEVGRFEGHREIWHNGGINGFVSELHVFPDDGVTIAVLTNTESGAVPRLAKKLAYAALRIPSPDVPLPDAVRDAVIGTYDVPGVGKMAIALSPHGQLELAVPDQPHARLEYRGKDTFAIVEAPITLVFVRDPAGKVTAVTIEESGQKLDAPRVSPGPQAP